MEPPNRLGLALVNERFDITLPRDIDDFYRRWDGGLLLFRKSLPLLSEQEMIAAGILLGRRRVRCGRMVRTAAGARLCRW